jgi:hypothetical protein
LTPRVATSGRSGAHTGRIYDLRPVFSFSAIRKLPASIETLRRLAQKGVAYSVLRDPEEVQTRENYKGRGAQHQTDPDRLLRRSPTRVIS